MTLTKYPYHRVTFRCVCKDHGTCNQDVIFRWTKYGFVVDECDENAEAFRTFPLLRDAAEQEAQAITATYPDGPLTVPIDR